MVDFKQLQKSIMDNRAEKGFGNDVTRDFCRAFEELSEAFSKYDRGQEGVAEEFADVMIFLLGMSHNLGFDLEKHLTKACGSLSGGQQKIVALSTAFATNPDFILLDEPENHLDIVSRKELINIMSDFNGGIIFISHDRLIIDSVATKIAELAGGMMNVTEGTYDDYIEMKMRRIGGMQREY